MTRRAGKSTAAANVAIRSQQHDDPAVAKHPLTATIAGEADTTAAPHLRQQGR
jgi:hypothetical protein